MPASYVHEFASLNVMDAIRRGLTFPFPEATVCAIELLNVPFRNGGAWVDRLGDTMIVNPGRQLGAVPAVIELDLEGGRLVWTSREGSGSTDPPPNWSR